MRLSTRKSLWLAASFGLSRLLCASLPAQTTSAGALPFTPALSPGEKENHASRITNPAASTTNSPTPLPSSNVRLSVLPQLPEVKPPVEFFRELLALEPEERSKRLADRSPESRKLVMAKVRQYLALKPDERELRLRVTELRWYLMPLLSAVATNRAAQLAEIPEPDRKSVTDRLQQWDKLPTNLQKELLEHEATLRYFTEIQGATEAQRHDMLK
ncbi:MAG: hypothetical protein DME25_14840, partial [Verrucomicrobia bacterium]